MSATTQPQTSSTARVQSLKRICYFFALLVLVFVGHRPLCEQQTCLISFKNEMINDGPADAHHIVTLPNMPHVNIFPRGLALSESDDPNGAQLEQGVRQPAIRIHDDQQRRVGGSDVGLLPGPSCADRSFAVDDSRNPSGIAGRNREFGDRLLLRLNFSMAKPAQVMLAAPASSQMLLSTFASKDAALLQHVKTVA